MSKVESMLKPLSGWQLWAAAMFLSMANLIAILDMTIANVSVLTIAGGLAVTPTQGTWVITSYAVAEAITVPLTGWFTQRYGSVKVFVIAMAAFGLCSALAGLSTSLGFLVFARVLQGMAGGPLMPLSQTLLLRIFPKEKAGAATGIWAMTTLVGPVLGPILGGWICDNYSWPWIFLINLPIAGACAYICWKILRRYETKIVRNPIDVIGFVLLIIWVGALQIMLDEGKNLDWFSSNIIVSLAVIAVVGFVAFLIWEFTEEHPIVDLRVFRHRGFSAAVLTISLTFAGFFAANVLTPLWLQSFMAYTATDAGMTTAWIGITAFFTAPMVAAMSMKMDPRKLVFVGVLWLGVITLYRTVATTDMSYWDIAMPLMLLGLGMPFFFIPSTAAALASVDEAETNSAAGLMNFMRTLSGAIATSMVTSYWEDEITRNRAELVGVIDPAQITHNQLIEQGLSEFQAMAVLERMVTEQSVMLATNELMLVVALMLIFSAFVIWLVPKPTRTIDPSASH
ncbi:DHA2 family efflux MFS transporter permease subunit [Fluviibacter phosphoraccumulans]|uniref:MFS transporter n=1 Tax=Fluviibacter phosphoraccumulans TaxID=1751046 RepID=A0A679I6H9_9RHOO|nr:DHA2 family efflux MFS transporter permease subunit [Fluviibacter phosphoraccumulans]BBU70035.1 MFS transporter [Fluviibacter phosphoraccumulans]BBU70773.1 MFS transporter [Fluviibacter phosphoraccumulans]BCA65873.1 MFS transporter [Fluviibacter phosphoraccumulans]